VYEAATYYASFAKISYAVTGSIDNGAVTNSNQTKEYEDHSDEMVFTAATGYHITGATVNGNAQTLPAGTTNTWTYPSQIVTGAITVAVTTEINGYDVTGTIDHSGTVSNGSQTVDHGSLSDEMVFTAATGYHIVGITINGSAQSLEGITTTYTYPATEVTGNIAIDVTTVEDTAVTLTYIAGTGGTVTDITSGEEVANTTEDVPPITGNAHGTTATNLTGYDFVNWTNSQNVVVSTSYSFTPSKTQGVYVAETYTANFAVRHHNFVVEDVYLNLLGIEVDELCSIEGEDEEESIPFNSEINSVKNDPIRGYEYSGMIVYVDEEETSRGQLSELGITIDVENGILSGNLPDHQIWVKYLYNEVEKYDVTYTSEGRVTGMPEGIPDAIAGDEITISTTVPVRDGYHFLGWTPQINGDPIEVTDGKFIMPESDVEIRASWEADENILNYNVLYYTSEDELIATIQSTVLTSDPVVTEVEDKAPEGYKLQGYIFNGGELTTELNAEITEDGQTITVYYEKNDLIVKHIYGSTTVYDSNQSKANLSAEDKITVNAVKLGKYTRIISATLNGQALGSVSTVTVVSDGERKYVVVFTYAHKRPSSDPTPGEEVTIIEDPEVALEDSLEKINHYAYVFGYENGTVRPENKVTREEVATIFYRLLTDGTRDALFTKEQDFPDVLASRWSNVAIATLLNGNIVRGYPDGEFKPGSYITRAEFATIVAKFDNLSYSGQSQFNDISGHWAENYINSAALKGWIKGYPDGSFHPEAYITRAEAITLINAVLGRQVDEDGLLPDAKYWPDNTAGKWYYEAIMEATNSHDYERESKSDVETWTAVTEDKTWTER
jgi:S-layer homology domain.